MAGYLFLSPQHNCLPRLWLIAGQFEKNYGGLDRIKTTLRINNWDKDIA
jgi:hypothetical protein